MRRRGSPGPAGRGRWRRRGRRRSPRRGGSDGGSPSSAGDEGRRRAAGGGRASRRAPGRSRSMTPTLAGPAAVSRAFSASSQVASTSRVSVYCGTSWLSVIRRAIALARGARAARDARRRTSAAATARRRGGAGPSRAARPLDVPERDPPARPGPGDGSRSMPSSAAARRATGAARTRRRAARRTAVRRATAATRRPPAPPRSAAAVGGAAARAPAGAVRAASSARVAEPQQHRADRDGVADARPRSRRRRRRAARRPRSIALSVSTSTSGCSPSATASPTATSTAITVPSVTSRPICGMTTSVTNEHSGPSARDASRRHYRLTIDLQRSLPSITFLLATIGQSGIDSTTMSTRH